MKKSLCLKKKQNYYYKGHTHYNNCSSTSTDTCSTYSSCNEPSDHHHHHKHDSCHNKCNCHVCNIGHNTNCDPCHKVEIKACKLPIGALKVEKTILNAGFIADGSNISAPDFSVTFEIVLTNCTCHQICDISIIDSLMGLKGKPFNDHDNNNFGGELRPYFTNVDIIGCDNCLVPLTFDRIIKHCGELLDTCRSYIEPCSIARLLVRITGRGFLNPVTPNEGEQTSVEKYKWTTLMQNSAVVRGNIIVDHCQKVPIFPIYIKSGIVKGWNAELVTDLSQNT